MQSNSTPRVLCGECGQAGCVGGGWPSGTGWGPADSRFLSSLQINRDYSFLDYILGGCQLMFTVRRSPPQCDPPRGFGPGLGPGAWGRREGVSCRGGWGSAAQHRVHWLQASRRKKPASPSLAPGLPASPAPPLLAHLSPATRIRAVPPANQTLLRLRSWSLVFHLPRTPFPGAFWWPPPCCPATLPPCYPAALWARPWRSPCRGALSQCLPFSLSPL